MVLVRLLRKVFIRKKKQKAKQHQKVLANWESMYKDLQQHPLTQAKIINEQILETTNDSLKRINDKLDHIDDRVTALEKQDPRPITRDSERVPEVPKEVVKIKKIVADADLSDQEEAIVKHLEKQGESDASTIAQQFNVSRSNASLKLNKLHDWGFLQKRLEGKTVFYRIHD